MPREIPIEDVSENELRRAFDESRDDAPIEDWPETETQVQRDRRRAEDEGSRARLRAEITDLNATIDDRLRHGATEESVRGDRLRLDAMLDQEDAELYEDEDEPVLVASLPPTATDFDPAAAFQAALGAELTADELVHWRMYANKARSADIAAALHLTQGAVSKREPKLVAKVDALHVRHLGHPYPAALTDRAQWGRPGRRRTTQE